MEASNFFATPGTITNFYGASYTLTGSLGWNAPIYTLNPTAATAIAPTAIAASTGVNPIETSYALYGHTIPLSVFGVGRIGGEIISGPWIENGLASFIISFGVPADPAGTRDIREIAFDSEVVWTTDGATGITTTAGGTFKTEAFTCRFYQGTLTQAADTLESTHYGVNAVAYRPQILLAFSYLPLANTKFGKIPYVAAVIGDGSGDDVNLGEAFERLAYSPWVGYTSAQFVTSGITDGLVDGGLIFAQPTEFLGAIQQFGRFYPTWDILQTDKLRIVDRGSTVTADLTLTTARLMGGVSVTRQEPDSVASTLELTTIDPDADYTLVPSTAQRPRAPVAVTTSVKTDTAYLPAIMDASTRMAVVTFTKYNEEQARKSISGTAMMYGLEMEPGALVAVTGLSDDFQSEVFKVVETLHGNNYAVEFTALSMLICNAGVTTDPYIGNVVLLLGFEDGADGTTVISDESPAAHGAATVYGSAQIDTAQKKFGASSGLFPNTHPFPGTGDILFWPLNADWYLGTIWTIECFVRFNSTASDQAVLCQFIGSGSSGWMFRTQPSGVLEFFTYNGSSFVVQIDTATSIYTTGTWYHLAADANGSKVRLYLNGVMVGSQTPTTTQCGVPSIEMHVGGSGSRQLDGWIDEVRLTAGIARYNTDAGFTPPAAAFPRT